MCPPSRACLHFKQQSVEKETLICNFYNIKKILRTMFLETGATVIGSSVRVMDQRRCVHFAFVFVLFANTTCVRMKSSQKPSLSLVSLPPLGPSNHRNENRIFLMMLIPHLITIHQHILSLWFSQLCLEIGLEPKNLVRIGFLQRKEWFFSLEWDLRSLSIGTNFAIRAPF